MKRFGKVIVELTVASDGLAKFADAMRKVVKAVEKFAEHHHRQDWWKRSEGPPDFIADLNDPEWWQDGDEPPPWGCAA